MPSLIVANYTARNKKKKVKSKKRKRCHTHHNNNKQCLITSHNLINFTTRNNVVIVGPCRVNIGKYYYRMMTSVPKAHESSPHDNIIQW